MSIHTQQSLGLGPTEWCALAHVLFGDHCHQVRSKSDPEFNNYWKGDHAYYQEHPRVSPVYRIEFYESAPRYTLDDEVHGRTGETTYHVDIAQVPFIGY